MESRWSPGGVQVDLWSPCGVHVESVGEGKVQHVIYLEFARLIVSRQWVTEVSPP